MKLDELIEILQEKRKEFGNVRVVAVGENDEIQNLEVKEGYDNCQEFMNYEDLGDPEFNPEMVLGIKLS